LERHEDVDPGLREKWDEQLSAAVEAEYRRQRMDLLGMIQWWFRDVWLQTLALPVGMLGLTRLTNATVALAKRISSKDALENLQMLEQTQRLLGSNVQEALALEVVLLKLKL
jgi:hypothetical protein